eukprot:scaffold5246_cov105-Isochrysis_galbana.AAC.3
MHQRRWRAAGRHAAEQTRARRRPWRRVLRVSCAPRDRRKRLVGRPRRHKRTEQLVHVRHREPRDGLRYVCGRSIHQWLREARLSAEPIGERAPGMLRVVVDRCAARSLHRDIRAMHAGDECMRPTGNICLCYTVDGCLHRTTAGGLCHNGDDCLRRTGAECPCLGLRRPLLGICTRGRRVLPREQLGLRRRGRRRCRRQRARRSAWSGASLLRCIRRVEMIRRFVVERHRQGVAAPGAVGRGWRDGACGSVVRPAQARRIRGRWSRRCRARRERQRERDMGQRVVRVQSGQAGEVKDALLDGWREGAPEVVGRVAREDPPAIHANDGLRGKRRRRGHGDVREERPGRRSGRVAARGTGQ